MKTFVLSTLSEEDVIRLEKDCNLAVRLQPDAGRIDPRALMDGAQAAYLLRELTDRLRFPSLYVTASLLLKQYSYCLLMPTLYAMTRLDKGLKVGADNCLLEVTFPGEGAWRARLHLKEREVSSPEGSDRASWREEIVGAVFRDHLAKVIRTVSRVSGLSPRSEEHTSELQSRENLVC